MEINRYGDDGFRMQMCTANDLLHAAKTDEGQRLYNVLMWHVFTHDVGVMRYLLLSITEKIHKEKISETAIEA